MNNNSSFSINQYKNKYLESNINIYKDVETNRNQYKHLKTNNFKLSDVKYTLSIADNASLVSLKVENLPSLFPVSSPRGVIQAFSKKSRLRMMRFINSIDIEKMTAGFFVTLTYPKEFAKNPLVWKEHLRIFKERLNREFPAVSGLWRLEPQRRGAPHFHLILWGCSSLFTTAGKKWLSRVWYEVVNSGDIKHLRAGTQIKRLVSSKQLFYYVSKYMAKTQKGYTTAQFKYPVGRYWGVWYRKRLAISFTKKVLTLSQFYQGRRILWRWLRSKGKNVYHSTSRYKGFSVFLFSDVGLKLFDYMQVIGGG